MLRWKTVANDKPDCQRLSFSEFEINENLTDRRDSLAFQGCFKVGEESGYDLGVSVFADITWAPLFPEYFFPSLNNDCLEYNAFNTPSYHYTSEKIRMCTMFGRPVILVAELWQGGVFITSDLTDEQYGWFTSERIKVLFSDPHDGPRDTLHTVFYFCDRINGEVLESSRHYADTGPWHYIFDPNTTIAVGGRKFAFSMPYKAFGPNKDWREYGGGAYAGPMWYDTDIAYETPEYRRGTQGCLNCLQYSLSYTPTDYGIEKNAHGQVIAIFSGSNKDYGYTKSLAMSTWGASSYNSTGGVVECGKPFIYVGYLRDDVEFKVDYSPEGTDPRPIIAAGMQFCFGRQV